MGTLKQRMQNMKMPHILCNSDGNPSSGSSADVSDSGGGVHGDVEFRFQVRLAMGWIAGILDFRFIFVEGNRPGFFGIFLRCRGGM